LVRTIQTGSGPLIVFTSHSIGRGELDPHV
jgi:hypothetical protein